jgi:hypothetical protein
MYIKKMKNILYPVFLETCQHTNDSFWKFIFKDLAFGVCPYGTYIDGDRLCCKFKGKEFNFPFHEKSSLSIFQELVPLLKNNLNIRSVTDISKKHEYIQYYFDGLQPQWKEIKKKSIRQLLIENYVLTLKIIIV